MIEGALALVAPGVCPLQRHTHARAIWISHDHMGRVTSDLKADSVECNSAERMPLLDDADRVSTRSGLVYSLLAGQPPEVRLVDWRESCRLPAYAPDARQQPLVVSSQELALQYQAHPHAESCVSFPLTSSRKRRYSVQSCGHVRALCPCLEAQR